MSSRTELRKKVEELLQQVEDVMVDVWIADWPWKPFATPPASEVQDRRRQQLVRDLQEETDPAERLETAQRLVKLGGYEVDDDGTLELKPNESYLFGHLSQIDKFGDLLEFARPFGEVIQDWDDDHPDWKKLEAFLLAEIEADPAKLDSMDLLDIRRQLLAWQLKRRKLANTAAAKKRSTRTSQRQQRDLTDRQMEIYTLVDVRGMSPREIADQRKITTQAVSKLVNIARRKLKSRPRSASVSARTNVQGLDQRAFGS